MFTYLRYKCVFSQVFVQLSCMCSFKRAQKLKNTASCHGGGMQYGGEVCVCVYVCESDWGGCPTVVSPVCSRKSWTLGTTIVTGSSPNADGFAFRPPATLRPCENLIHGDTSDQPRLSHTHLQHGRNFTCFLSLDILDLVCYIPLNLFPHYVVFFSGLYARAHTHMHTSWSLGLNTFFPPPLFSKLPLYCLSSLTAQSGLMFLIDNHNRHLSPAPPLHPHFNPLPIPLYLPLLFVFCSEWRSKAAVSASFPSLIALLAGGGTRSFSDTDGEGGGSIGGGGRNGWLVFVVVTFHSHLFSGLFAWTLTPRADTDTLLTLMPVKATYGGWQGEARI